MSDWQDIKTAPKEGKNRYKDPASRIDILAKTWLKDSDTFEFRRFTDCYWSTGDSMTNRKATWNGIDDGYLAVAWMPIPEIPKEWPPKVEIWHAGTFISAPAPTAGAYATPDAPDGNQPADEDFSF